MDDLQSVVAVRVPLESISRYFRLRQKAVERELDKVVSELTGDVTAEQMRAIVHRLTTLKHQLETWISYEKSAMDLIQSRLKQISNKSRSPFDIDISIAEYLARQGHGRLATMVLSSLPPAKQSMFDLVVCNEINQAAQALREKNLGPALAWAHDNASRLRRLGSQLEFQLRKREFVELIRAGKLQDALTYASSVLAPAARGVARVDGQQSIAVRDACMQQLQHVLSILAFPHDPMTCGVPEVEYHFKDERWLEAELQFRADSYAAAGFRSLSTLEIMLRVGITALKTPSCAPVTPSGEQPYVMHSTAEQSSCPLCQPGYFACWCGTAPMLRRSVSQLRCPISGDMIDDANPPLALPNGRVYGSRTVELVTSEDKTKVFCPKTGEVFAASELRKVYIL